DAGAAAASPPPAPQWVSGVVQSNEDPALAARVATSDDPITHRSFDLNVDVKIDPQLTYLAGASRDTTPQQDHLHLEREAGATPRAARRPRPGRGAGAAGPAARPGGARAAAAGGWPPRVGRAGRGRGIAASGPPAPPSAPGGTRAAAPPSGRARPRRGRGC